MTQPVHPEAFLDPLLPLVLPEGVPRGGRKAASYTVIAIERALDVLDALSRIGPATLAQVAEEARCTRTAGFRVLRTLESRGFAFQDSARGAWRLGGRCSGIGQAATRQGALAAAARPILRQFALTAGENVILSVREGIESVAVCTYHAAENLRRYRDVGQRRPLHAGSNRLLLAYAPPAVHALVLQQKLARYTSATIADPQKVAADLPRIRGRGYLIVADEVFAGVTAIAVPVRDISTEVIGMLSVAAPTARLRPPRPRELVTLLLTAAAELSDRLGYRPPR